MIFKQNYRHTDKSITRGEKYLINDNLKIYHKKVSRLCAALVLQSFVTLFADVGATIVSFGQHVIVKHRDDISLQCLTVSAIATAGKLVPTWTNGGHNLALGDR